MSEREPPPSSRHPPEENSGDVIAPPIGHALDACSHGKDEHEHGDEHEDEHRHASDADHGEVHEHEHEHDLRRVPAQKLRLAFAITLGFMFIEFGFGLYTRSLALTSDAGHLLADAGSLLLALIAQRFAERARTHHRTYGFRRAETLAAFLNGLALTITAMVVLHEAWTRWKLPVEIRGQLVVAVGLVGLVVNLFNGWILARGEHHNLNTRAAFAHVAFDAVGSIFAIASGFLAWRFGWQRVDPVLSFAMAGLILFGAWIILKRAVGILMEGTPAGLDLAALERTIRTTPGVADLHDLHAWTISEGFDVVTVHVVLDGTRHGTEVARDVGMRIHTLHHVEHVTVQPEAPPTAVLHPPRSLIRTL